MFKCQHAIPTRNTRQFHYLLHNLFEIAFLVPQGHRRQFQSPLDVLQGKADQHRAYGAAKDDERGRALENGADVSAFEQLPGENATDCGDDACECRDVHGLCVFLLVPVGRY